MVSAFQGRTITRGACSSENPDDFTESLSDLSGYLGKNGIDNMIEGSRITGRTPSGNKLSVYFSPRPNLEEGRAEMIFRIMYHEKKHSRDDETTRLLTKYEGPFA